MTSTTKTTEQLATECEQGKGRQILSYEGRVGGPRYGVAYLIDGVYLAGCKSVNVPGQILYAEQFGKSRKAAEEHAHSLCH